MKVQTLSSGSSGNCTFIDSGSSKILVDAGVSPTKLASELESIGVRLDEIDAVVVSHEHADHAKAITAIPVPVYVSEATMHLWKGRVDSLRGFCSGSGFAVGDIEVETFPVPHDAIDPVGFVIRSRGRKVGIVTDAGSVTGVVSDSLCGCDMLIVESNHDEARLLSGRYPWELKQRIGGTLGHLSNRQCSNLLAEVAHVGLRFVILAHLSESNNMPELALTAANWAVEGFETSLHVAPRRTRGEEFIL